MGKVLTRSELRKVRSIATLIGQENLRAIPNVEYLAVGGKHVYCLRKDGVYLSISVWNEPKENASSRCLFSDSIRIHAFNAALDYWPPNYSPERRP
jgi:hypothetical protein